MCPYCGTSLEALVLPEGKTVSYHSHPPIPTQASPNDKRVVNPLNNEAEGTVNPAGKTMIVPKQRDAETDNATVIVPKQSDAETDKAGAASGQTQVITFSVPMESPTLPATLVESRPGAMPVGYIIGQKYKILAVLGSGGFGVVYKVEHLLLHRKNLFALKVLHPQFSLDPDFRRRFINEVEVSMEFLHEHVIPIRDYGETETGAQYFTMDFSSGKSLRKLLDEEKQLPEERALNITRQILTALQQSHSKRIIHRDLKPENILIENREGKDHALVLDFGLAKVLSETQGNRSTTAAVVGTPNYMSPEQAAGEEIDKGADIYALGVILYEMVTGALPFAGNTKKILMGHMTQQPRFPHEVNPNVSRAMESIILKAMAKEKNQRFASAEDFIVAIDHISMASDVHPEQIRLPGRYELDIDSATEVLPKPEPSHQKARLYGIIAGVLLLVSIPCLIFFREQREYDRARRHFTKALAEKKFEETPKDIEAVRRLWFYRRHAQTFQRNLEKAQTAHLHYWLDEGKERLARGDFRGALQSFAQARISKSDNADKEMELAQAGIDAKDFMEKKEWENALVKWKLAEAYLRQNPGGARMPTLSDETAQCEKEIQCQSLLAQVRDKLAQGELERALHFLAQVEHLKPSSVTMEIVATKTLLEGKALLHRRAWQAALEKFQIGLDDVRKQWPDLPMSLLSQSMVKCQDEIRKEQEAIHKAQDEGKRNKQIHQKFQSLQKAFAEKMWHAIPPLLEQLERESLSTEESRKLASLQSLYPPLRVEVFAKNRIEWEKATDKLTGGCHYKIKLEVSHPLYIYGFQQDNSAAIEPIFPKYARGGFRPFENPVLPGKEYLLPPGTITFILDRTPGQEFFYFVYSNFPITNPAQLVEEYLLGRSKYPLMVVKTFNKITAQ